MDYIVSNKYGSLKFVESKGCQFLGYGSHQKYLRQVPQWTKYTINHFVFDDLDTRVEVEGISETAMTEALRSNRPIRAFGPIYSTYIGRYVAIEITEDRKLIVQKVKVIGDDIWDWVRTISCCEKYIE